MVTRRYAMEARTEAMRATRERILDVAVELFGPRWYDEVTLADLAREAGVSTQTIVNHFGSKEQLFLTGVEERIAPGFVAARARAVPGDLESIVVAACGDYETSGDGTVRLLAQAHRLPELSAVVANGRIWHLSWVESCFAPWLAGLDDASKSHHVLLLATLLDVSTWHSLRRQGGLDIGATRAALLELVEPLVVRLGPPKD